MTDQEKTANTRIALAVAGIQVQGTVAEMVWRVREALTQKGGMLTVDEILAIEEKVRKQPNPLIQTPKMVIPK